MGTLKRPHRYVILRRGDFRPQYIEASNREELHTQLKDTWRDIVAVTRYHGEREDQLRVRKVGRGIQDVFLGAIWIGQVSARNDGKWQARVFTSPFYRLELLPESFRDKRKATGVVLGNWHLLLRHQSLLRTSQTLKAEVQ